MFESALEYCHGYIDSAFQVFQRKLKEPDVNSKELQDLLEEIQQRIQYQVSLLRSYTGNV